MSDQSYSSTVTKLGQVIIKARLFILIVFAVSVVVLGYSATQFKINASADTLLTQDNELYIKMQMANQKFSPSEFILVGYQPRDKKVFSDKTIQSIKFLSEEFAKLERVESINSMLNVPLIENKQQLLNSDVKDLTYEKQQYSLEKMRKMLTNHPIYTDLILNKAADATSIQLVFKEDPELKELISKIVNIQTILLTGELSQQQQTELSILKAKANTIEEKIGVVRQTEVQEIEAIIANVSDSANVYIGGSYVVGIRLVEIVKQDLLYFGLAISVLISVLLLILFRSVRWLIFPLFACASSVALTMGVLSLLKIPATIISANFVALQLILTIAIMLHLITCYREISRDNIQFTQHERLQATLTEKLAPCFFAAITTSVGFGSLIFSGIQPVIDFGIMMLISNVVTLCVALLVFPALLSYLPATKESGEFKRVKELLGNVRKVVTRYTKSMIVVPLIVLGVISIGITRLNVENSFIDYFHHDTQIYKELSFIDKQFGGSTPLDIIIDLPRQGERDDIFLPAEYVNTLHLGHAVVDAFEATGNVTSLINFTTLAKQLNNGKPLTEYELDVIYKLVDKEVIDKLIGSYIDIDTRTMRISTRIQDTLPGLNRAEFIKNINADLQATGLSPQEYQLTSLFVLYQDILSRLFDSQIATLGIVYVALTIILLLIFRSVKIALIALVPNIITTTAILGVIGWFNIPLDLMTITIAAIAMGIAIDDTIHFVDAYISGQHGEKLKSAFSHTGLAITYTTSLIAAGFGMFVFSDFMPSVYFGLLTACAMFFALFTDLTVLPSLLNKFVPDTNKET
jgi:hypothetical protein